MKKSIKKKIIAILGCAAIAGSLGLAACGDSSTTVDTSKHLSVTEFYGVGAVSTAKLLGSGVTARALGTFGALGASAGDAAASENPTDGSTAASPAADESAVKAQAENFNKYFEALDIFMDDDAIKVTTAANTDAGFEAYATKLTVDGKDLSGKTSSYTMYYNETLVPAEADDDDDDDDDNDNEQESEYSLDGVMVSDGTTYKIDGIRSTESEDDEQEEELKIRAHIDGETGTYVEMEQEVSVESNEREIEYVYRVYQGGAVVEETAVEFGTEQKNNKVETEYELEFRNADAKGKYSVDREVKNNGKTEIKVKYTIDGKSGHFMITETDKDGVKTYTYTFSDNTSMEFDDD